MKKGDSVESLMRSEECDSGESRTKEEDTLGLQRSLSENIPTFLSNDTPKTSPKSRKSKSIKSRLSFRLRFLRDGRSAPRKTRSSDALQQNLKDQSVDDSATESGLQSELGSGEVVKKKRKLARKFLLSGIKWPKSKTVDENLMTIATQTSAEAKDNTAEEVAGTQTDSRHEVAGKAYLGEPKQKLLITISGRKTEYKSPPSNAADIAIGDGLLRININPSEKDTSSTERNRYQESAPNLTYTVASTDNPQSEFAAQEKGAVRKSSRSPRLERQASREEFLEEDKLQYSRHDLSQERGSRFPRPTNHAPLKAPTNDERLSRVLDYVKEAFPLNNLNAPNTTEKEVEFPIETPAQSINKVSDTRPLGGIQKNKNSSIFHSVNSNDSDSSPLSDAGRKRIKYVGQPTLYTDEEKEILEGKREAFRNLAGISEYSFESDCPNETQMPAFSDLVVNPAEAQIMMSGGEKREHLYKILVIGELGTGKTSFIKRYVHQFFSANYRATIGVDFALKVLHWDQNTIVRLQLWDIAGQERFGNMTRVYYKEAVGAFIVFDVTRSGTFDAVSKWKEDLDSKVQLPGGGPIPCILLANKCDQDKQGIVTNPEKMDEYVKENGFSGWFETSAKENTNIEEAARALVSQILLNDKLITAADVIDNDKFALGSATGQQVTSTVKKNCSC